MAAPTHGTTRANSVEERGQDKDTTYPVSSQHLPRSIHTNRRDHARLYSKETGIQERNLRQELAERSRLDVVIVGLADLSHPAVR